MSPPRRVDVRFERGLYDLISEAQFQQAVIQRAELYGWWWWHDTDSRRNHRGLPDLILVRPPRVLFVELKRQSPKSKVTREQAGVLAMLERCPTVESYVWRPSDELSLDAILRRE